MKTKKIKVKGLAPDRDEDFSFISFEIKGLSPEFEASSSRQNKLASMLTKSLVAFEKKSPDFTDDWCSSSKASIEVYLYESGIVSVDACMSPMNSGGRSHFKRFLKDELAKLDAEGTFKTVSVKRKK
jgi:hypothetical protein